MKADNSFTDTDFKEKIVYRILKRAPSKYAKNENNENKEINVENTNTNTNHTISTASVPPQTNHDQPINQAPIAQFDQHQHSSYYTTPQTYAPHQYAPHHPHPQPPYYGTPWPLPHSAPLNASNDSGQATSTSYFQL